MRFFITFLAFALLVLGVLFLPQSDTPAEEFKELMPMEFGDSVTKKVDNGTFQDTEYVKEEFILTQLPKAGIELYLPKDLVDVEKMHDFVTDGPARENGRELIYVSTGSDEEGNKVSLELYRYDNGCLTVYAEDITDAEYKAAQEVTLESKFPNLENHIKVGDKYEFERVELKNEEGFVNVHRRMRVVEYLGNNRHCAYMEADVYTEGRRYKICFYDFVHKEGYAEDWDTDQKANNRLDRMLYFIRRLKVTE